MFVKRSRACLSLTVRRLFGEGVVDLSGHVAFQAAHDLAGRQPLSGPPDDVGLRALVCAHTADHHHVQGRIELSVAAAVEPMSLGLSARGRDRAGAAHHGEARLALQPLRVVACRHDEGAGVLDTNAFQVDETWSQWPRAA